MGEDVNWCGKDWKELPSEEVNDEEAKKITSLNLSKNKFQVVPDVLTVFAELRTLDLRRNQITTLPPVLSLLPRLQYLKIASNKLASPCRVPLMVELVHLDLSRNNLTSLHEDIFFSVPKLTELLLQNNELNELPHRHEDLLQHLKVLNMNRNRFTTLPPYLIQLESLETLHIKHNQIEQVPPVILLRPSLTVSVDGNPFLRKLLKEISTAPIQNGELVKSNTVPDHVTTRIDRHLIQPRALVMSTSYTHLMDALNESSDALRPKRSLTRHQSVQRLSTEKLKPVDTMGDFPVLESPRELAPTERKDVDAKRPSPRTEKGDEKTLERDMRRLRRRLASEQKLRSQALSAVEECTRQFRDGISQDLTAARKTELLQLLEHASVVLSARRKSTGNKVQTQGTSVPKQRSRTANDLLEKNPSIMNLRVQFSESDQTSANLKSSREEDSPGSVLARSKSEGVLFPDSEAGRQQARKYGGLKETQRTTKWRQSTAYQRCKVHQLDGRYRLAFSEVEEGEKPELIGGEILALFRYIVFYDRSMETLSAFLCMYRSYVDCGTLLEELIKLIHVWSETRAGDLHNDAVYQQICRIVQQWIEHYFALDFSQNAALLEKILEAISLLPSLASSRLQKLLEYKLSEKAERDNRKSHQLAAINPREIGKKVEILTLDPAEVARQMTLIEYEMLRDINPVHCISRDLRKQSTHIQQMITRFNITSRWVCTEIVMIANLKKRVAMVKFFIDVAEAAFGYNNFNAVLEIVAGLSLSPTSRLQKTWASIPKKQMETYHRLLDLMDGHHNFACYRKALEEARGPTVPYFGIFLRDVTFVDDSLDDKLENGDPNFHKMLRMSFIMQDILTYQSEPYAFDVAGSLQNMLLNVNPLSEDTLYEYSIQCEPPGE